MTGAPLTDREFLGLQRWVRRLGPWGASPRRRRLLFLALAAPGFAAVFGTPLHHNLFVLVLGGLLFAAAYVFRARTEPLFIRAEATAPWPARSEEHAHV